MDKVVINELKEKWKSTMKAERWPATLAQGYLDLFDQLNTATQAEEDAIYNFTVDMANTWQNMVDMEFLSR